MIFPTLKLTTTVRKAIKSHFERSTSKLLYELIFMGTIPKFDLRLQRKKELCKTSIRRNYVRLFDRVKIIT